MEQTSSGLETVAAFVQPLLGQPCWRAKLGYARFLTFEFGQPHLEVREPRDPGPTASERTRRWLAGRGVFVHGEWHLWIYMTDWLLCQDGRPLATSRSRNGRIERAVSELQGQALAGVAVAPDGRRAEFHFDQGGWLVTVAHRQRDEPAKQWLLFGPDRRVLTVRDDGRYTLHPGTTAPEQALWLPLV